MLLPPEERAKEAAVLEAELLQRELCRRSLKHFTARFTPDFLDGWHIDTIANEVETIIDMTNSAESGRKARSIIEAPPRHGKSQLISRCTPLWYIGKYPHREVVVATYGQDLADMMGRWVKMHISSPEFNAIFPGCVLNKDSLAANRVGTTKGGGIRFVGIGAALTGQGAHLAIVDDPHKDRAEAESHTLREQVWDWYTSVLLTRLAPGGGVIVLHTRWHHDDLIGRLEQRMLTGGPKYRRIKLQAVAEDNELPYRPVGGALHPARYNEEALKAIQEELPPRDWLSLYQQKPMPDEGNIFKNEDFHFYKPGSGPKFEHTLRYVVADLAVSVKTTADRSCIWDFQLDEKGEVWWSPDMFYGRHHLPDLIALLVNKARDTKAAGIIIEGGVIWRAMEQQIKQAISEAGLPVYTFRNPAPIADKVIRSRASHAMMAQGRMHFPDVRRVHEIVVPQFLRFDGLPGGEDDIVDTVSLCGMEAPTLLKPQKGTAAAHNGEFPPWSMPWIEQRTKEALEAAQPKSRYSFIPARKTTLDCNWL